MEWPSAPLDVFPPATSQFLAAFHGVTLINEIESGIRNRNPAESNSRDAVNRIRFGEQWNLVS